MRCEWDEAKRELNIRKHGVDFGRAHLVYEADFKLTRLSPRGNEIRHVDIAEVAEGQILALVHTLRADAVRVISLRRAKRKEKRQYAEAKNRSLYQ